MYLNQALGQASEAIGRLENLVAYEHLTVVEHPQPVKEFSISSKKFPSAIRELIKRRWMMLVSLFRKETQ